MFRCRCLSGACCVVATHTSFVWKGPWPKGIAWGNYACLQRCSLLAAISATRQRNTHMPVPLLADSFIVGEWSAFQSSASHAASAYGRGAPAWIVGTAWSSAATSTTPIGLFGMTPFASDISRAQGCVYAEWTP